MPKDYRSAASTYESLTKICPGVDEYKIYFAQSLYKVRLMPMVIVIEDGVTSIASGGHVSGGDEGSREGR